ncbi:SAM-dependent methyltransferase [Thermoactinospora rubra]|uniref:SAM-dependent methyltransferase n=1 Tax=Thermoactinospora rubra TaxID=1088767 RepID=UPI0019810AB1|nr:methyltransferase domain-containing protein [Thermoactinospora rubra]
MSLRFHEISEGDRRILNPLSEDKLALLGRICHITPGTRHLDLACGKGELLSTWAATYGLHGVGMDISHVFLDAARKRAAELGVSDQVTFVHGDAGAYEAEENAFDIVSCIGATWIGGGLSGTLDLMRRPLRPGGLALVGETYWITPPPSDVDVDFDATSLAGTAERLAAGGYELVEMVLASQDDWDRYVASQWWTITEWLRANPDDPDAPAMRDFLDRSRRPYLEYQRRHLGWGVFVTRLTG